MPSPVFTAAFVVKGKILPAPPVQRMMARPSTACISPLRMSNAATPPMRPPSTRSRVAKYSS